MFFLAKPLERIAVAAALATICIAAPSRGPVAASRTSSWQASHKPDQEKPPSQKTIVELPVPWRAGETLNYQLSWATFDVAATMTLATIERRDLSGWNTWHFRALAHTLSPVRSISPIDDQFDSYTDATTLDSHQYEISLDDLGKQKRAVFHLIPRGDISHGAGPGVVVMPGTRDPLGAFYSLRTADWNKTPKASAPVYDGRDIYEMRAQLEAATEAISVPAGKFTASRVSIHAFQNGKQIPGVEFLVWLANNPARTPVQIQANLPVGGVRASLVSVAH
ncbi:MAG: DUF3108 domain-containing protein [Candidatus Acidiferrales bacterium]